MQLREQLLGQVRFFGPADDPGAGAPAGAGAGDPAGEAGAGVGAAVPGEAGAGAEAGAAAAPVAAKPTDWKDARIAELTAKLNAEKAKRAQAPAVAQAAGETAEAFQARVDEAANEKALALAQANDWNTQCNAVAEAGKKEFPDFQDRLVSCQSVVNAGDPIEVQQFNEILAAAIETGQAHKLIHSLGETPGEVKKLMSLSPLKRAVQMAKMAAKLEAAGAEDEPSALPKPVRPLGSKGLHYDGIKPDDAVRGTKLPIGEWMKQREKQAAERGIQ